MKKITLSTCLFFVVLFVQAQGLERIIIEKYYISDAKDTIPKLFGNVPPGSVTYRVYVDMLPGYTFQAAYGIPGHELRIATTTKFFNSTDYGNIVGNTIPYRNLQDNNLMLDSWLSVGAGAEGCFAVPKSKDDGASTVVNASGILQNQNPWAGIPLKLQDGLIFGSPKRVTSFGIDSLIYAVFYKSTSASVFSTSNGSWACLGGAMGPDSLSNEVLIGQFTTDGDFSFELNIQIGKPKGGVENYVARNKVDNEKIIPSLIYSSVEEKKSMKATSKSSGNKKTN